MYKGEYFQVNFGMLYKRKVYLDIGINKDRGISFLKILWIDR